MFTSFESDNMAFVRVQYGSFVMLSSFSNFFFSCRKIRAVQTANNSLFLNFQCKLQ